MSNNNVAVSGTAVPRNQTSNSPKPALLVAYGSYLILPPVGLIIAYLKRGELSGTIYRSHADWLIGTFWYGFVFSVMAALVTSFAVGGAFYLAISGAAGLGLLTSLVPVLAFSALAIWYLYRVVKGGLRLYAEQSV